MPDAARSCCCIGPFGGIVGCGMGNIGVGVPEGVPEGVPDGSVGPGFEVALSCHQYCTKCY